MTPGHLAIRMQGLNKRKSPGTGGGCQRSRTLPDFFQNAGMFIICGVGTKRSSMCLMLLPPPGISGASGGRSGCTDTGALRGRGEMGEGRVYCLRWCPAEYFGRIWVTAVIPTSCKVPTEIRPSSKQPRTGSSPRRGVKS